MNFIQSVFKKYRIVSFMSAHRYQQKLAKDCGPVVNEIKEGDKTYRIRKKDGPGGVQYYCPCDEWSKNQFKDRECKHTKETRKEGK